jgi:hypothetical protein
MLIMAYLLRSWSFVHVISPNLEKVIDGLRSVLGYRGPGDDGHGEYYPVQRSYAG